MNTENLLFDFAAQDCMQLLVILNDYLNFSHKVVAVSSHAIM